MNLVKAKQRGARGVEGLGANHVDPPTLLAVAVAVL